jgi:general secretion pathway protein J
MTCGFSSARCRALRGFTLIELMVAIAIMAMLAVASWRGIDGMARAQSITRERSDQIVTLQTALAQWQSDLNHVHETQIVSAIDYDGLVFRVTRRDSASDAQLRIVAWTRRARDGGLHWLRWQSAPLKTRAELQTGWNEAGLWAKNATQTLRKSEVDLARVDDMQIFYLRSGTWTNPLSSGSSSSANPGLPVPPASSAGAPPNSLNAVLNITPDGVRLVLKLSEQQALSGPLTLDWVRPIF